MEKSVKNKIVNNKAPHLYMSNKMENAKKISESIKSQTDTNSQKIIDKTFSEKVGEEHPFNYKTVEGVVKKFGLPNAIIEKYTDYVVGPGLFIECEDDRAKQILDDWILKNNFQAYLEPWLREAFTKGTGYLEVAGLSTTDKNIQLKVVNSNTMYVKRDKFGNIVKYNQYLGDASKNVNEKSIIPMVPGEIIQADINKFVGCGYGYGIVYPALTTINDFLMAQKAMHKVIKRKGNIPIHVKMGDVKADDWPEQADIDAFGEKLQYMDETTEWVTGPNVEMKTIDFGDISKNFATTLDNDYKLLSYSFQVPLVLLGEDRGYSGSSEVQMDAFERRIRSIQSNIGYIIKEKIFRRVLRDDFRDVEFKVIWGQQNEAEKEAKVTALNTILNGVNTSPGMQTEIEKEIAATLGFDYDRIEEENEEAKAEMEAQMQQQADQGAFGKPAKPGEKKPNPEREREENQQLPGVPGQNNLESIKGVYKETCKCDNCIVESTNDYELKEWINFDYDEFTKDIIKATEADHFLDLLALNKIEEQAGYLTVVEVNKMKDVFKKGFRENLSVKEIQTLLEKDVGIKTLYKYTSTGLIKENGKKVKVLDKKVRTNMIARTETVRLANLGAIENYKKRGAQQVRWISSLSDRTCPICESLNGQVFDINNITSEPPEHAMCRCTMAPVVQI